MLCISEHRQASSVATISVAVRRRLPGHRRGCYALRSALSRPSTITNDLKTDWKDIDALLDQDTYYQTPMGNGSVLRTLCAWPESVSLRVITHHQTPFRTVTHIAKRISFKHFEKWLYVVWVELVEHQAPIALSGKRLMACLLDSTLKVYDGLPRAHGTEGTQRW
jgi:hypothetical protein